METCPREGNNCSKCLTLARESYASTYQALHSGISESHAGVVAENAGLQAVIAENPRDNLESLSCYERRIRAYRLGREVVENTTKNS